MCLDPRRLPGCSLAALRRHLRDGTYVQVDVDMARLQPGLGGKPWLHEVLICGTDQGRFEVYALDRADQLRRWWIEDADLRAALQVDGPSLLEAEAQRGEDNPDWLISDWRERPLWILHRPTTDQPSETTPVNDLRPSPDRAIVQSRLTAYLKGEPSSGIGEDALPADTHWGQVAQLQLATTIRRSGQFPPICLRLWWEHKRIMAQRLQWLADQESQTPRSAQIWAGGN